MESYSREILEISVVAKSARLLVSLGEMLVIYHKGNWETAESSSMVSEEDGYLWKALATSLGQAALTWPSSQGSPMVTATIIMDSQVSMSSPVGSPLVMVAIIMKAQVHKPTSKGSPAASITMKAQVHQAPASESPTEATIMKAQSPGSPCMRLENPLGWQP